MSSPDRLPRYVFFIATALFIGAVLITAPSLPARIATHFDAAGNADGWMSRTTHVASFLILGLAVSAFILGLVYVMRFFPSSTLNAPRADYWRRPANYPRACAFLFQHAFWIAATNSLFFAALHLCIVQANTTTPPTFPTAALGLALGAFLSCLTIWAFFLIRFFLKTPRA